MFENNALFKISPTNDRLSLKVDLYSVVNNNISDSNFLLQLCVLITSLQEQIHQVTLSHYVKLAVHSLKVINALVIKEYLFHQQI